MTKKKCYFDQKNINTVDHYDAALLSRFLTPWGKIKSHGESGLCSRHQRMVARAIKRARMLGVLTAQPRVGDHDHSPRPAAYGRGQ